MHPRTREILLLALQCDDLSERSRQVVVDALSGGISPNLYSAGTASTELDFKVKYAIEADIGLYNTLRKLEKHINYLQRNASQNP